MTTSAKKSGPEAEAPERSYKNVKISKDLHRRLKVIAAERGADLQDVLEEYLSWALAELRSKRNNR